MGSSLSRRSLLSARTFVLLVASIVGPSLATGQCERREDQALSFDDEEWYYYGKTVASHGDTLAVSASHNESPGFGHFYADLYVRRAGTWTFEERLGPLADSSMANGVLFSMDEDLFAVAMRGEWGFVDVYRKLDGHFQWEQTLYPPTDRHFGSNLQVDDGRIYVFQVTYSNPDGGSGKVHVFAHDGTQWFVEQTLTPADPDYSRFGASIHVSGDRMVIGAPSSFNADSGAAIVYARVDGEWVERQRLLPPERIRLGHFGAAVRWMGDQLVVGMPGADSGERESGQALLFAEGSEGWEVVHTFDPPHPVRNGHFGENLHGTDDRIGIAGYQLLRSTGRRGVSQFRFDGQRWLEQELWRPLNPGYFGFSMASIEETDQGPAGTVVGDYAFDRNHGAAFVYDESDLGLGVELIGGWLDEMKTCRCGGLADARSMLAVVDIDDAPSFHVLSVDRFDAAGVSRFDSEVPPALVGHHLGLRGLGFRQPGRVGISARVVLELR